MNFKKEKQSLNKLMNKQNKKELKLIPLIFANDKLSSSFIFGSFLPDEIMYYS